MRQGPEYFGDKELELIYVAKKLKEALRLEEFLTGNGIDYLVEPDKYSGGIIFRTERVGAFFYVDPDVSGPVRETMQRGGFVPYATGSG